MTINLDGIGEDWVVTRKPGGKPELHTYASLGELQRVLKRALLKAGPSALTPPVVVPEKIILPLNGAALKIEQEPEPEFDCQTCGLCCVSEDKTSKTHARLEREDKIRIGKRLPILRRADGDFLRTKKTESGVVVCAALDGQPGESCACSIYEDRPLICQLFEIGGDACLALRDRAKMKA